MTRRPRKSPCITGGPHWFTVYGMPGLRSPVCRRCFAPNPRPLTLDELREYEELRARGLRRLTLG